MMNKKWEKLQSSPLKITLKCFFGFEEVLAEELKELGFAEVEMLNRAVRIEGTWKDVYFLNLYSRCAISVLVELDRFFIQSEKDLYDRCMGFPWSELFDASKTFAVKGAVYSSVFKNSHYPYLLVKDAVVDTFRNNDLERPDIDIKKPQVLLDLYVKEKEVTLSINTSGLPLFQRGYRTSVGDAPLNEVVAASLIRLSGWDRKTPFFDPFCGSGTILIEAALLASGIPSNIERQHYAFKNLKNFDEALWEEIYEKAPRIVRQLSVKIFGSDISDEMVLKSRRNLRNFSFGRHILIEPKPFLEVKRTEDVFILTNPPYGERLEADIPEMYDQFGTWLKHEMAPCKAWVVSSSNEGFKSIGLKPSKKKMVYNGDLECSFQQFELYEGSRRKTSEDEESKD
jgi:putative N6-adenine-specific DNA methylase